jgi:hypothetical protein
MQSAVFHSIEVALTREEWQSFRDVAQLRRMTLSDFMREALRLVPIAEAQERAVPALRAAGRCSRVHARPDNSTAW